MSKPTLKTEWRTVKIDAHKYNLSSKLDVSTATYCHSFTYSKRAYKSALDKIDNLVEFSDCGKEMIVLSLGSANLKNKNGSVYMKGESKISVNGKTIKLDSLKVKDSIEYKLMGGNYDRAVLLLIENLEGLK